MWDHEVKGLAEEKVNKLVDTYGEEIYVEYVILICMFKVGLGGLDSIWGRVSFFFFLITFIK